jgi:hypothetical protein
MKEAGLFDAALVALALTAFSVARADDGRENVISAGVGGSKVGAAASVTYLRISNTSGFVWGADLAWEGAMSDSTGGNQDKPRRALAFDILLGGNLGRYGTSAGRFDAMVFLGARQTAASCPRSYLGYQCYADSAPDVSYAVNYGAALTWAYERVLLGARVSGESVQALLGYRF